MLADQPLVAAVAPGDPLGGRRSIGLRTLVALVRRVASGGPARVAIERPRMRGRIELAWRAEGPLSPAARALIDHARAALRSSGRP